MKNVTLKPRIFRLGIKLFFRRLLTLFNQPVFVTLTIVGNGLILVASLFLYHIERGVNPRIDSLLDTVWWAVATVTTVGYGDVHPITTAGKIVGIFMMIVGTALFWCYTALFAGAVISDEISEFEIEMRSIERALERIEPHPRFQKDETKEIINRLEVVLERLRESERNK